MRISDWSSDVCSSDLGLGHDADPLVVADRLDVDTRATRQISDAVRLRSYVFDITPHFHSCTCRGYRTHPSMDSAIRKRTPGCLEPRKWGGAQSRTWISCRAIARPQGGPRTAVSWGMLL